MRSNETKRRVAMLAHTQYLLDPRVRREAEALAQAGVEVHVIGLAEIGENGRPEPRKAIVNGVRVHRLPIRKRRGSSIRYLYEYFMTGFLGALQLTALHLQGKLTVVHVHNMPDILVLAALVPRLTGSKVILDIHDPMPELSLSSRNGSSKKLLVWFLRLQEKISCRLADRVISVNDSMRENLRDKGVPSEKVFIVHNFPDRRVFPLSDAPALWPRSQSHLSLLYCGTITEHYDLAVFVKAISRLAGEIPVKLRIAGGGTLLAPLLELARTLGVEDCLELIGVIPLDRVHLEMKNADVGISCQRRSVFGDLVFSTKIVEYFSQGLPVLTPQTYTATKYLPADSVFYFEPGNDAALADALRFMWRNPAEVLKRLQRAMHLLPRFSWQAEKEKFLDFYTGLLRDKRRGPAVETSWEADSAPSEVRQNGVMADSSHPSREERDPLWKAHLPASIQCNFPLERSIARLQTWVEANNYKAYEPFDGLSSYLRPLTCGSLLLDRILMQAVRQSPLNLRPVLGIKPLDSTKGRGYMAWGYLALYDATGIEEYKNKAIMCLDWLIPHKSPLYSDHSWANHFDFASRSGRYSKDESIIVWTSLIGQAFLEAYEILNEPRYLDIAKSICRWILKLPRESTQSGTCLSYMAPTMVAIHNSNMLGAAMLARTAKHTGEEELLEVAKAAMQYSCSRQLPDGGWYYGEKPQQRWIDNFHTGYNLDSLKCYIESTGDETFRAQLNLGFQYFTKMFFDNAGRPGYYHNRPYPIDIQCAAQAIETLANFADCNEEALAMALKVARWTIEHMQDSTGYFYYRQYPFIKAKTPMLHWGQATMFRALALLRLKLEVDRGSREIPAEVADPLKHQVVRV